MHNGIRAVAITALVWSAVGGGLAHAQTQTLTYDDTGVEPTLTQSGATTGNTFSGTDHSLIFEGLYNPSDFTHPPSAAMTSEVAFTEGKGADPGEGGGGISDLFIYRVNPTTTPGKIDVRISFNSDDGEGTLTPAPHATMVTGATGSLQLGIKTKETDTQFRESSFGNALALPTNLIVMAASDPEVVPEPASTASLGLLTSLLALVGAIRVRKRAGSQNA